VAEEASYSTKDRLSYWQKPGSQKLLNLLKQLFPSGQWQPTGEKKLQGCCPFHNDSSPSAFVDLNYGLFKCSGCGTVHTDLVRFLGEATQVDYATAFKRYIIVELGLKVHKKKEKDLEAFDAQQELMKLVAKVSSDLLSKAANNPGDPELQFAQKAIGYLRDRQINVQTAISHGVGVFPRRRDVFEHPDITQRSEALFETAFLEKGLIPKNPTSLGRYGGELTFPYYTAPDTIGRIKLRTPEARGGSSWVGPGVDQGFFGLNTYKTLMSRGKQVAVNENIYVVEGEFDQLSARQAMDAEGVDTIIVGGSGSGVDGIGDLKYYGFKKIIVVGDNDVGGLKFVKLIFKHAAELQDSPAAVYAFEYPSTFLDGDDPDEIIKRGGWLPLNDALHNTDNWMESHTWATRQVEMACDADAHIDMPRKLNMAREYGYLVPEGLARSMFIEKAAELLGLSKEDLHLEISTTDSEKGFVFALKRELNTMFEPLVSERDNTALCYSRVTRRIFRLPTKQVREMLLTLQSQCFETDLSTWVAHKLGTPGFIIEDLYARKSAPRSMIQQHAELSKYVSLATESYISESSTAMDDYQIRKQGVHFLDADNDAADKRALKGGASEKRFVVVNGLDVYLGELRKDSVTGAYPDRVYWDRLDRPLNAGYMFDTDDRNYWSKSIQGVEDLNTKVTFEEAHRAYSDIKLAMRECFDWSHPDIHDKFWAAFCFTQTLATMVDNFPLASALGPTQSGKSTFIKRCLRGDHGFGFLEHADGYDDYTAAGITQAAAGSSLLMCIDEFEDADDASAGRRSSIVQNSLEMFRNISEGTSQTRGTQSGDSRRAYMRFPIVAAHIHPFKREEDLNRWVTCKMVPNRDSRALPPAVKLQNMFTPERFAEIRRCVTLYALQNAGLFYKMADAVSKEVFEPGKVECREHRFLHSMSLPLAFVKHFGDDHMEYINNHVQLHEQSLSLSVASEEKKLFRAVFLTKGVVLAQDSNTPRSVLEVLNDSDYRVKLSGANSGVYYKEGKDFVVIDPYSVSNNILQKNSAYRGISNSYSVFQRLMRHEEVHHKPDLLIADMEMQNHLATYISHISLEELLIVYLRDLRKIGNVVDNPIDI